MGKRNGFTLIELLVVIAIIALLMAILMPALNKAKEQARSVTCLSNLKQWGLICRLYADSYKDFITMWMPSSLPKSHPDCPRQMGEWVRALGPYYQDPKIRLCPSATKGAERMTPAPATIEGSKTKPWISEYGGVGGSVASSYGFNDWVCNAAEGRYESRVANLWKGLDVRRSNEVPVMGDCRNFAAFPEEDDEPPPSDDASGSYMARFCIDRHKAKINMVFADLSVRPIGLKELWTLRWHRSFNIANSYTMAGNSGKPYTGWPDWMTRFKDY